MMIHVPKGLEAMPAGSNNGNETTNLSSLIDIFPTLDRLCNLEGRTDFDGNDLSGILSKPEEKVDRAVITTYDYGDYSIRKGDWHYIHYIDESEELYNLKKDPEEWENLAENEDFLAIKKELKAEIPNDPVSLPEESLIELMEHHIPPVKSKEFYYSTERIEWLKRFNTKN